MTKPEDNNEKVIEYVNSNISKLRNLCESAPMSYANKVYYLEAEMAVLYGDVPNAIKNYEEAISLSNKYGLRNEEAMACERIAMLFLNINAQSSAFKFLWRSYRCYDDWHARAKMHQLTKKYPIIFSDSNQSSRSNFAGMQLEKDSECSVSQMSQSNVSFLTRDDEYFKCKRKRS